MKKNISAILIAAMVLSLAGCNSPEVESVSRPDTSTSAPATEPSVTEKPETTPAAPSADADEESSHVSSEAHDVTSEPDSPETTAATTATTAEKPVTTTAATVAATEKPAETAATTAYGPTDIGARPSYGEVEEEGFLESITGEFSGIFDSKSGVMEIAADAMEAPSADDAFGFGDCEPIEGEIVECPIITERPQAQSGLLTGGEWRDNDHWADWNELYGTRGDWAQYKSDWRISFDERIAVKVTASNGEPVEGAKVSCASALCSAVTDNKGMAYLFYTAINGATEPIVAELDGISAQADGIIGSGTVEITLGDIEKSGEKKLDFMIMCDTTGSMSDELEYLKEELKDIIRRVKSDNSDIPVRLSVNFYRDEGDEYIVREYPFTTDIDIACDAVGDQYAAGGGDTPEAVHTALDSALNHHDWDEDAVKIMFIVLDAPPHADAQIIDSVNGYISKAAEMGIRVVPIASSGIDKSTEYLLRTMAFTTGGTYTFLTDDSGVGGGHIEPTVGAFNVEKLNDMMVRIVNGYLS